MKQTSYMNSFCDSQHEHEENMGHRSMSVCTRISLYIYIHIIYICIIFIGIYTLCIEKSNSIIYIEKAFFLFVYN